MKTINVYTLMEDILSSSYSGLPLAIKKEADTIIYDALRNITTQKNPSYSHVAGIPCAGKSTFIKQNISTGVLGKEFILIAFDTIMLNLSGYKKEYGCIENVTTESLASLFAKYEMPARIIGYELLQQAINNKLNIVFENSGSFLGNLTLMEKLKEAGYEIIFHSIECAEGVAISRVNDREKTEQRHTPKKMIEERFRLYEALKYKYKALASQSFTHITG